MTNDNAKTVVYSAQAGGVTEQVPAQSEAQVAPVQPTRSQPAPVQPAQLVQGSAAPLTEAGEVEYQPMDYADPGAVTEQFDHLATRDPEQMLTQMGSGDQSQVGDDLDPLQTSTFSPEAAALAGGNETTHHNFGGAVTRVDGGDYDLSDPADSEQRR